MNLLHWQYLDEDMTNQNQIFFIEQFIICIFIYPYISGKKYHVVGIQMVCVHK